jgi:hypothetical protein
VSDWPSRAGALAAQAAVQVSRNEVLAMLAMEGFRLAIAIPE